MVSLFNKFVDYLYGFTAAEPITTSEKDSKLNGSEMLTVQFEDDTILIHEKNNQEKIDALREAFDGSQIKHDQTKLATFVKGLEQKKPKYDSRQFDVIKDWTNQKNK